MHVPSACAMLYTCHACAMRVPCICVCLAEGALAQDAYDLVAVEYMVVRHDGVVASLVIVPWAGLGSGAWHAASQPRCKRHRSGLWVRQRVGRGSLPAPGPGSTSLSAPAWGHEGAVAAAAAAAAAAAKVSIAHEARQRRRWLSSPRLRRVLRLRRRAARRGWRAARKVWRGAPWLGDASEAMSVALTLSAPWPVQ
eukprot:scaffold91516_cov58-Phaeocystis_antarctica.AAC.5